MSQRVADEEIWFKQVEQMNKESHTGILIWVGEELQIYYL